MSGCTGSAMSGTAALCEEFRWIQKACNTPKLLLHPHKWMFTNFDCSAFYVADRKALIQNVELLPEYLKISQRSGAVFELRDWHVSNPWPTVSAT